MKKYVIGCAVAALLLLGVGGIALWFLVLKPATQLAGDAVDGARSGLGQIGAIAQTVDRMRRMDEKIVNRSAYSASADGRIEASQVTRFLAVQSATLGVLGPEFAKLESARQVEGMLPIAEGLTAVARLGTSGIAAKTAQVEALNAQGMSLDEYRWIRSAGIAELVAGGFSAAWQEADAASAGIADAARNASQEALSATAGAVEGIARMRQAAEAASAALRGEPLAPATTASKSDTSPPAPAIEATQAQNDSQKASVRQANLALVAPHAEAFARAKLLATLGL
jgi:hypothetical protein